MPAGRIAVTAVNIAAGVRGEVKGRMIEKSIDLGGWWAVPEALKKLRADLEQLELKTGHRYKAGFSRTRINPHALKKLSAIFVIEVTPQPGETQQEANFLANISLD